MAKLRCQCQNTVLKYVLIILLRRRMGNQRLGTLQEWGVTIRRLSTALDQLDTISSPHCSFLSVNRSSTKMNVVNIHPTHEQISKAVEVTLVCYIIVRDADLLIEHLGSSGSCHVSHGVCSWLASFIRFSSQCCMLWRSCSTT